MSLNGHTHTHTHRQTNPRCACAPRVNELTTHTEFTFASITVVRVADFISLVILAICIVANRTDSGGTVPTIFLLYRRPAPMRFCTDSLRARAHVGRAGAAGLACARTWAQPGAGCKKATTVALSRNQHS